VVKAALGLAAGVGAVVALVVTTRRQRLAEAGSHRDDSRLFTERYSSSAEQLGHERAAVRLAGVYAMSRLADDWEEQRQICIDVLCAYLRMPYPAAATSTPSPAPSDDTHTERSKPDNFGAGEREVRLTIIRVIRDHLQYGAPTSWEGKDFDFTGATFDGGSFTEAIFSSGTVDFSGAEFSRGTVDFANVGFSGAQVNFRGAKFSGGTVSFYLARFELGAVDFFQAEFSGGTVYSSAIFSGGMVGFYGATFSGGMVHWSDAEISSGVSFSGVSFSGGTVDFSGVRFSGGTVDFRETRDWSVPPVLPDPPPPEFELPSVAHPEYNEAPKSD
jgi:hypothetical protein